LRTLLHKEIQAACVCIGIVVRIVGISFTHTHKHTSRRGKVAVALQFCERFSLSAAWPSV